MIIARKKGDILMGDERHIAFAVNTEGINDSGFAGMISRKYWNELANIGECKLGTVLSKELPDGRFCHALVCHSLRNGWQNQRGILQECFDNIPCGNERIASIAIGTGLVGILSGADFDAIINGMQDSKKDIIVYMV